MPFIPPNTQSLKELTNVQSRIALMGAPFTGKTQSALTFPNPVVVNLDNKLGYVSKDRTDIIVVPFHDPKFVDGLVKRQVPSWPANVRDAFKKWLNETAPKLERDQTLIIDSWTMLNHAQEQQEKLEPTITKKDEVDKFAPWNNKVAYFVDVCKSLRMLACDVIVIMHESDDRHKIGSQAGELNGKIRPLMTGQFKDQLLAHFTDTFRQHAFDKPADWKTLRLRNKTGEKWIEECYNSTPLDIPACYLWQTYSDDICDGGSTLKNPPPFIPANYESFKRYKI